jgi:hypothetical protein
MYCNIKSFCMSLVMKYVLLMHEVLARFYNQNRIIFNSTIGWYCLGVFNCDHKASADCWPNLTDIDAREKNISSFQSLQLTKIWSHVRTNFLPELFIETSINKILKILLISELIGHSWLICQLSSSMFCIYSFCSLRLVFVCCVWMLSDNRWIARWKKHCFRSNQFGIHGDLKNGISGYYRLAFPIGHLSPNPLKL